MNPYEYQYYVWVLADGEWIPNPWVTMRMQGAGFWGRDAEIEILARNDLNDREMYRLTRTTEPEWAVA